MGKERYDISGTQITFMTYHQNKRANTQRLTVVLSGVAFKRIEERSQQEGRSMSNLVAYLVERALDVPTD